MLYVIPVLTMQNTWFVPDLQLSLPLKKMIIQDFDVSQADYYNIEFICSSKKKMLINF